MTKKTQPSLILLRWSDRISASDVQDPLGLSLRGSARLASRLLYCITSITPRARYFSFIPWCIYDFQQREKHRSYALGLRDAIIIREQMLTLACVAHHEGESCVGGGLVGSRDAKKWLLRGEKQADFQKIMRKKFSKNPALGAYLNSLVNLGVFVTENERPDVDEEETQEDFTFDDIELSELGLDLAKRYDQKAGALASTRKISSKERRSSVKDLSEFGRHGGLCELSQKRSADRELLRDLFFGLVPSKGESHRVRRQTLLLIMELCRQLSADDWILNEPEFASAVYFNEIRNDDSHLNIEIPPQLHDICKRWRMFYFHHFMSVALESMFSWLVSQLGNCGIVGTSVESLVERLSEPALHRNLSELLHIKLKGSFGDVTPERLFANVKVERGVLNDAVSKSIDHSVRSLTPFAEDSLEDLILTNDHLFSSTGLALPMILLSVSLARFSQWEATDYGKWLANTASDQYLDLIPPLVNLGLNRRFGDWWTTSFRELTTFVLSRYVIQQHQSMSYEKTSTGERCLLQIDGSKVVSTGGYDRIGMGNSRLHSALQILSDLGLVKEDEDKIRHLTPEGKEFLKRELAKEAKHEVS